MIKHVIFDLDGTLFDTSEGILKSIKYTLAQLEVPLPSEEIQKKFIGPPIEKSFEKIMGFSKDKAKEAASIFRKAYPSLYLYDAEIYDGIESIIDEMREKNIVLSVATYKRESYTKKLLEHFSFYDKFDYVFGSDDEGKMTKLDIINMCIDKSGIDRNNTVMIGDTVHDALAAKAAKIKFIAVTYGFGFKSKNDLNGIEYFETVSRATELKNTIEIYL